MPIQEAFHLTHSSQQPMRSLVVPVTLKPRSPYTSKDATIREYRHSAAFHRFLSRSLAQNTGSSTNVLRKVCARRACPNRRNCCFYCLRLALGQERDSRTEVISTSQRISRR